RPGLRPERGRATDGDGRRQGGAAVRRHGRLVPPRPGGCGWGGAGARRRGGRPGGRGGGGGGGPGRGGGGAAGWPAPPPPWGARGARCEEIARFRDTPLRQAIAAVKHAAATLAAGFTTVRDLGGPAFLAVDLRASIDEGLVPGPRVVASGPAISITGGHGDL